MGNILSEPIGGMNVITFFIAQFILIFIVMLIIRLIEFVFPKKDTTPK